MSITVIKSTEHIARKKHIDDGRDYINDWIGYGCWTHGENLTFSEWRSIAKFKQSSTTNYILPGEKYTCQFNTMYGELYTFKMKTDLFKIACKLDLFAE